MKTAIVYYSRHHENTKKVLQGIAKVYTEEIDLIDVTAHVALEPEQYDIIGFASGIYYGKFQEAVMEYAQKNLPKGKDTFLLYTAGAPNAGYFRDMKKILQEKKSNILGEYGCKGFDTFGPFKLIGGVSRKHPDVMDLQKAQEFYSTIREKFYRENV